jgi:hypothetical protein
VTIHPESLLRHAPVRHWLADTTVRTLFRGIDQRWFYDRVVPRTLTGFNPYTSGVYLPRFSAVERWWNGDREASVRPLDPEDHLIREVFLAVHEYIHVWTVHAIAGRMPELGFGSAPITAESFEDFVYCHLLTEAAAVAAIDYWYLCGVDDVNDYCDIGTSFQGGIASPLFRRRYVRECRRHAPSFDPYRPELLSELCVYFCTGEHELFTSESAVRVPLLRRWIDQEAVTRRRQLVVTREWLAALAPPGALTLPVDAPVEANRPWMIALREELAAMLWKKIHDDELLQMPAPPQPRWSHAFTADHRYVNVNAVPGAPATPEQHYVWQRLQQRPFDAVPPAVRDALRGLAREQGDYDLALRIIEQYPALPASEGEPAALLFDV